MNLTQLFAFESIKYKYNELKNIYIESTSITRNKIITLPRINKTVSNKSNNIKAIKIYNQLPKELKNLDISKKSSNNKLKEWINDNIYM